MTLSLISNAYAADAAAQQGSGMFSLLPLFILIVVFYFLILRPQQKRSKEQQAMISALQKGDEVITTGGLLGRISRIGDNYVGIEVADNVVVQVQKSAVQSVLPKGTIKSN
jgi:preprotein translocase subunit YajC